MNTINSPDMPPVPAHLSAETDALPWEVTFLHDVARLLVDEPDVSELSRQLAEKVGGLLSADQVFVAMAMEDGVRGEGVWEDGRFRPLTLSFKPGQDIPGWTMTHLRPFRSQDSSATPTLSPEFAHRFPCHPLQGDAVLAVPILNHQLHVLGVIEAHRAGSRNDHFGINRLFSDRDLYLLQTIALMSANALERAKLLGSMQQWASSFQHLLAFNAALNEQHNVPALLRRLVQHAAGFLGAVAGLAGLVEGTVIQANGYWGHGQWQPFQAHWSPQEGLPGWVFSNQWPYMTNDYPADKLADGRLTAVFDIRNALCVPILGASEEVLGFVELHNKKNGQEPFTWSDVSFMSSLANSTAVALQNARLLNQLETQRAQLQALSAQQITLLEEERRRIARELHDQAGQALIGIKLGLQVLSRKIPPEIPGLREELDRLRQHVNNSTTQLRDIARALRPPILDEMGLEMALNQCLADFRQHSDLLIHFDTIDTLSRLPQTAETACYRIVQEALTNVAQHARATHVWITLFADLRFVYLNIRDDGIGFDTHKLAPTGLGLLGMQERAKMLGGTATIESALGIGTAISVAIPISET